MEARSVIKLCVVVSSDLTVKAFLLEQIRALSRLYCVTVIANTDDTMLLKRLAIDADVIPVRIERKLAPYYDIKALIVLYRIFKKGSFSCISSVTPKAGLLAMTAGFLARIPKRIHTYTGQVWATKTGIKRFILKTADRFLAFMSTQILVDSFSQRNFLISEEVISEHKSMVLAQGSISGVDVNRFIPNAAKRRELRLQRSIPEGHIVFLYLGRINRDKGIIDLAVAFASLSSSYPQAHLLLVGPDEADLIPQVRKICGISNPHVHYTGYTESPEIFMAGADVFCMPSYREGFGSVIIEAAASGIPSIGTRIYGITDAIQEGITGLLYTAGNINELVECMKRMINEPVQRRAFALNARQRAVSSFSQETVTSAVLSFYRPLLSGVVHKC